MYIAGSSAWRSVMTDMGGKGGSRGKIQMCAYSWFTWLERRKLTQHCNSNYTPTKKLRQFRTTLESEEDRHRHPTQAQNQKMHSASSVFSSADSPLPHGKARPAPPHRQSHHTGSIPSALTRFPAASHPIREPSGPLSTGLFPMPPKLPPPELYHPWLSPFGFRGQGASGTYRWWWAGETCWLYIYIHIHTHTHIYI